MIRYDITEAQLENLVGAEAPTWFTKAAARTTKHQNAGKFTTKSPDWGDVKEVFLAVQHSKCAYCERKLEGGDFGLIEHDIEHYRPKNKVPVWPNSTAIGDGITYTFDTGDELDNGYFLLAHNIFNYVTSCKTCNSILKKNFFPIDDNRIEDELAVKEYDDEKSLIPLPVGDRGIRPETVIEFVGILAIPSFQTGFRHRMGRVTIDFFRLNARDRLREERAKRIVDLALALKFRDMTAGADRQFAVDSIDRMTSPRESHTSCARAFKDLFENDRPLADQHLQAAKDFLDALEGI